MVVGEQEWNAGESRESREFELQDAFRSLKARFIRAHHTILRARLPLAQSLRHSHLAAAGLSSPTLTPTLLLLPSRWTPFTAPNARLGARASSPPSLQTQSILSSRALGTFKKGRSASGTWSRSCSWLVAIEFSSARLNTKLEANNYPPMTSLVRDLSDGVRLIQLMVSTRTLPRDLCPCF